MTKRKLKIESPCHMQWAELKGAGAKRFCGECALHVVDGSAMTKSAAEQLVQSADDRVCMRVAVDAEGEAIHQPEQPVERPGRLAGIGLTIASTMLVACGEEAQEHVRPTVPLDDQPHRIPSDESAPERPHEIMGGMVYVEPNPTALPDPMEVMGEIAWEVPVEAHHGELMGKTTVDIPTKNVPSVDQDGAEGKGDVAPGGPHK